MRADRGTAAALGAEVSSEGSAMPQYVIKHRQAEVYVAAQGGSKHAPAVAQLFPARDAADEYMLRSVIPADSFAACEVPDSGWILPGEGPPEQEHDPSHPDDQ